MKGIVNVKNGTVVLNQVHFKRLLPEKNVLRHDRAGRQGKIVVPGELIGKKVMVILLEDE